MLLVLTLLPVITLAQAASRDPHARFEGIWNSATATALERPRELKDKAFFTPQEAAAWEQQTVDANAEPPDDAPRRGTGTYNTVYREFGSRVVKTRRTSIVIDPSDGRIPTLTPAAARTMGSAARVSATRRTRKTWGCRTSASRSKPPGRRCCRIRTTAIISSSSRAMRS